MVRQKYREIALQDREDNRAPYYGAGGCYTEVYKVMSDDYTQLESYAADANLGL